MDLPPLPEGRIKVGIFSTFISSNDGYCSLKKFQILHVPGHVNPKNQNHRARAQLGEVGLSSEIITAFQTKGKGAPKMLWRHFGRFSVFNIRCQAIDTTYLFYFS